MRKLLLSVLMVLLTATTALAQQVYLSPLDGAGTDANPWKSRCWGLAGGGNIDLRTDFTKATGYMLCASNALPANQTGIIVLGASKNDATSTKLKSDLQAATGVTVKGDSVVEVIKEIVIPKMKQPSSGNYEIYLGGKDPIARVTATFSNDVRYKGLAVALAERAEQVIDGTANGAAKVAKWALFPLEVSATVLATEPFTASDGDLAGCEGRGCVHTWTEPIGGNWTIVSNKANCTVLTGGIAVNNSSLATSDMDTQVTLSSFTVTGGGVARVGVASRKASGATDTFYRFFADVPSGAISYELQKRVAGATTSLGTNAQDPVAGDVLKMRNVGDQHTAFVNGVSVIGPITDTSITTSTVGGIWANASTTTINFSVDDYIGQDYTAPSTGRTRGAMMLP